MKSFTLTLLISLCALVLKSQNINTSRENDKKKKDENTIIDNKTLEEKVKKKDRDDSSLKTVDELNRIQISEDAPEILETIVASKNRKKYKSKDKKISPPAQKFRVKLLIQNKNPHPMWYLMPFNGSNRLPANGLFNAEPTLIEGKKMLSMRLYQGETPETYLREILFTGLPEQHFRAFYLPAGATLSLRNYDIDCWQDSETVEFWAVKELKANNNTELQNVLPFETLSSIFVEINCPSDENCATVMVAPDDKIAVSTEPIRFVKADKVSKYLVRLNQPQ